MKKVLRSFLVLFVIASTALVSAPPVRADDLLGDSYTPRVIRITLPDPDAPGATCTYSGSGMVFAKRANSGRDRDEYGQWSFSSTCDQKILTSRVDIYDSLPGAAILDTHHVGGSGTGYGFAQSYAEQFVTYYNSDGTIQKPAREIRWQLRGFADGLEIECLQTSVTVINGDLGDFQLGPCEEMPSPTA